MVNMPCEARTFIGRAERALLVVHQPRKCLFIYIRPSDRLLRMREVYVEWFKGLRKMIQRSKLLAPYRRIKPGPLEAGCKTQLCSDVKSGS